MAELEWRRVAADADAKEGQPLVVEAGEEKVLLVRLEGKVHAVGHKCPHYEEKLEKGVLFGTEIVCKSHFARMDVRTGRVTTAPAYKDLPVYPVKIEDGGIWLAPAEAPRFPKPSAPLGSDTRTFVIVGGGAAGSAAAESLRRHGFAGRIVVVNGETERPYDRPTLSKDFLSGKAGEEWLPLRGPKFYPAQGIEILAGRRVVALDAAKKTARLDDGSALAGDAVLIATGGTARRLTVPGGDGPGVHVLRSAADARAILADAAAARRALVVGAGFIGLEVASSLRDRGLDVTVVAPEALPLAGVLGDRVGAYLKAQLEAKGVSLLLGRTVAEVTGPAGSKTVTLSDGSRHAAGFVVAGLGIVPELGFLAGTGLVEEGAVPVDADMRTRAAGIYAAGDIAAVAAPGGGRRRVEHWVVAQRQGARAAAAMMGRDPGRPEVEVFWSKFAGTALKYVGHGKGHDQVVYRGSVEQGKFLAGYFTAGSLVAAAAVGRAQEIVAMERLLRFNAGPTAAAFADESFDLVDAARRV